MMKKLINKKETFLTDMIEGMLIAHPELDLIANTVIVKKAKKRTRCSNSLWRWKRT